MDKSPDAFRTISEVATWLETPAHVLRFWESRFPDIKPLKRAGGRRYYRPEDMRLLGGIKHLLHTEGHTIKSVQDRIKADGTDPVAALSGPLSTEQPSAKADKPDAADGADGADGAASAAPTPPAKAQPVPAPNGVGPVHGAGSAPSADAAAADVGGAAAAGPTDPTPAPPPHRPSAGPAQADAPEAAPQAATESLFTSRRSRDAPNPSAHPASAHSKAPDQQADTAKAQDTAAPYAPTVAGATGDTTAKATYHLKDASAARPAPVPAPAQDGADDGRPGEPSIGFFFDDSDDAEPPEEQTGKLAIPPKPVLVRAPLNVPPDPEDDARLGVVPVSLAARLRALTPSDIPSERRSTFGDKHRTLSQIAEARPVGAQG